MDEDAAGRQLAGDVCPPGRMVPAGRFKPTTTGEFLDAVEEYCAVEFDKPMTPQGYLTLEKYGPIAKWDLPEGLACPRCHLPGFCDLIAASG